MPIEFPFSPPRPNYDDPAATGRQLLLFERAEHYLDGLGSAIAQVGFAASVVSGGTYALGEAMDASTLDTAIEITGRGGLALGAALLAAGGLVKVYEPIRSRMIGRRRRDFVKNWVNARWLPTDDQPEE